MTCRRRINAAPRRPLRHQARGASAATASTTVIAGMRGRDRARQAKAGLLEQAGIFLDGALAPAAQHHHLQVEPAAGTGAVIGRQRRFQHQHARVRAHRAADIGRECAGIRHRRSRAADGGSDRASPPSGAAVANTSPATKVTPGSGPPSPRLAAAMASAMSNSVARGSDRRRGSPKQRSRCRRRCRRCA